MRQLNKSSEPPGSTPADIKALGDPKAQTPPRKANLKRTLAARSSNESLRTIARVTTASQPVQLDSTISDAEGAMAEMDAAHAQIGAMAEMDAPKRLGPQEMDLIDVEDAEDEFSFDTHKTAGIKSKTTMWSGLPHQ